MRAIRKGAEPPKLRAYRLESGAVYDGPLFSTVKKQIRDYLLKEQGHLCAYCMQRICAKSMKVEHWHCQKSYPSEQLKYHNMLGVCPGNEGQFQPNQTCDTRKGCRALSFNPSDPTHANRLQIRYDGYGKISSDNPAFDCQLNDILNLNWTRLQGNRKNVWDAITTALNRTTGACSRAQINLYIKKWRATDPHGMMAEYGQVAIYYLEKKLKKMK